VLKAAEAGQAASQHNLGVAYSVGNGVKEDHDEAVRWFLMAAKQGYAASQVNLFVAYTTGKGAPVNPEEAMKWCLASAKQGLAPAQYNLGVAHVKGQGVEQDYVKAVEWLCLASDQDDTDAKSFLAALAPALRTDAEAGDPAAQAALITLVRCSHGGGGQKTSFHKGSVCSRLLSAAFTSASRA
jgi:TPR repeat protein